MMKLFIKLIRDIRQSIGQFIAFVLVIAVGAFFYAGLVTLSDDLSDYTKAYFEEHNLSDLNVYYERISKQAVASLSYTTIIEGRIPNQANEILLDSHYAQEHQYQVGDQIQLSVNNKNELFIISALGENVEYAKKNEIQDHRTSGFGYVSEAALPLIAGSSYYNEILIDAKDGYDIDQLGRTMEEQSKELPYLSRCLAGTRNSGDASKVA